MVFINQTKARKFCRKRSNSIWVLQNDLLSFVIMSLLVHCSLLFTTSHVKMKQKFQVIQMLASDM